MLVKNPEYTLFRDFVDDDAETEKLSVEIPFDQSTVAPDTLLTCTVPARGDYISRIQLKAQIQKLVPDFAPAFTFYSNTISGNMRVYTQEMGILTVTLSTGGFYANTVSPILWNSGGITTFQSSSNKLRVSMIGGTPSYVVFDTVDLANFWGFTNGMIKLLNGFVRFNLPPTFNYIESQVTLPECGWLPGPVLYTGYSSNNAFFTNTNLVISGQSIQNFPTRYMYLKQLSAQKTTNIDALGVFEGDQNQILEPRTYYYTLPFTKRIPLGPQIQVFINVGQSPANVFTLIVDYETLKVPIRGTHNIVLTQLSPKNHTKAIIGDTIEKMTLNGETLFGHDEVTLAPFENLFNPGAVSNISEWYIFNNPINMSRIREPILSGSNVYIESYNVLSIKENLAGLRFNS
jgi:hypothetical protein